MRLHDWQSRLADLVAGRLHQPFEWGLRDCALWAADVVHAVTGEDHAAKLRGTYGTQEEAAKVFAKIRGLEKFCIKALGEPINPLLVQSGDIGLTEEESGPALVAYAGLWMGQGPNGLVAVNESAVLKVWGCTCRAQ